MGLTTPPWKTYHVTEIYTSNQNSVGDLDVNGAHRVTSHHSDIMTAQGESLSQEALGTNRNLMGPKSVVKVGAWNVRTMYQASKTAQVLKEMERYKLDLLGVSECRWTGSGKMFTSKGYTILYSGRSDNQHSEGVAIIMNKPCANSLLEWEPVNERLIRARFDSSYCKTTLIQCYAPTNDADEEVKDSYYDALQALISRTPQHDVLLITGDQNAKVGSDNSVHTRSMGKEGYGTMNENGERLANLCSLNGLVIGGTIFKHRDIHKITWQSPNGRDANQIDHIIINGKWRGSLLDTRTYRGADVNSDHFLVVSKIRLKLKNNYKKTQLRRTFNVRRLKEEGVRQEFSIELRNKFSLLEDLHMDIDEPEEVGKKWNYIKKAYIETCENVIGFNKSNNKDWITDSTWQAIEDRCKLKEKVLSTKSPRLKQHALSAYQEKDREVKKSVRRDKQDFLDGLANQAELAAAKGDLSTVYKITKQLSRQTRQSPPIRDSFGKVLTNESDQAARWVQHFQSVLNRPDPVTALDELPQEDSLDITTDPPSKAEVLRALRAMKSGKAPGVDGILTEMLKADADAATDVLTDLFGSIWLSETIPADWCKGLIIKLPKKGDLSNCDNWRGITLLSLPSKIFCRILLDRINSALDTKLRPEQAGFRKGRGCIDQIFTLRNIIEQSIEWKAPLFLNFIDFKKAFDSVHRDSLWRILRSYGVPAKITTLIRCFYQNFECTLLLNNNVTDWFAVRSGVRQGCILSPILFLVAVDWVMRRTTNNKVSGIQWTLFSSLEDLDFADDIALLSSNYEHMQEKTDRLNHYANQIGLHINSDKTQEMRINTSCNKRISVNNAEIQRVESFTYLGAIQSTEDATQKDIKSRLAKGRAAFHQLKHVWKSKQYSCKTKIRIYNSNVKAILLYGSECWRVTKRDMSLLSSFHHNCLRRICHIFWPNIISNKNLLQLTKSTSIIDEIKQRRFKWLGHVLRMPASSTAKVALRWTPQGKRPRGRPKNTWRRTVGSELKKLGLTWGEAEAKAKDRAEWRKLVWTLCSDQNNEDK